MSLIIAKTKFFKITIFFMALAFVGAIMLPIFVSRAQSNSADAIAIRVVPNPQHYSAYRWYLMQGFRGSPQSLVVDGYEAVRDGRTVYVNVANVISNQLYTNIYLISYNQDAESATSEIFSQILAHWKFNANYNTVGHCRQNADIFCYNDSSCPISDFCDSAKARVTRDTKRLSDMTELNLFLEAYKKKNSYYPKLAAGSYLANRTISVWPSWNQSLGNDLDATLPLDPINKLGACPAGFSVKTCWNEGTKQFSASLPDLPDDSLAYVYMTNDTGSTKNLCYVSETGLTVMNLNLRSATCQPVCLDFDNDGFGNPPSGCADPRLDCNDNDPLVNPILTPMSPEVCNDNRDNDCDGFVDCNDTDCLSFGGCSATPPPPPIPSCGDFSCSYATGECVSCPNDCMGDPNCCGRDGCNIPIGECNNCGVTTGGDCGVSDCCGIDPACNPFAGETPFNCADCALTCTDADSDSFSLEGGTCGSVDCDDGDAARFPGNPESCDGKDNDCDSIRDNGPGMTAESCGFVCKAISAAYDYVGTRGGNKNCCGNDPGEQPYSERVPANLCGDTLDNDCDTPADGADSDCSGTCAGTFISENLWYVASEDPDCNQCGYGNDEDGDQSPGNWNLYPGMADQCDGDCNPLITGRVTFANFQNNSERLPSNLCNDGIDNDCDGTTDGADPECGGCVSGSTQPCGTSVGECTAGTQTCSSGVWGACTGAVGPVAEVCDGRDNDCDGTNDNGLTAPLNDTQFGVCLGSRKRCSGAGGWVNDYSSIPTNEWPAELSCDNLDNNCDNTIDEGLSRACYTGAPATRGVGECRDGTETCAAGSWGACAGERLPVAENCGSGSGNGLDEDCDGVNDNGCVVTCTFPAIFPCVFF